MIAAILKQSITKTTGIPFKEIVGKSRKTDIHLARVLFCSEAIKFLDIEQVAELVNRSRSEMYHLSKVHKWEMSTNDKYNANHVQFIKHVYEKD